MSGASVYILLCADASYYTGVTRRAVDERVSEHNPVSYTHLDVYKRQVLMVWRLCR